jgi:hypothetical protein
MLASYSLVLWLVANVTPASCGTQCVCPVPQSVASSPERMMRHARQGAFTIVLGTVIAVDTTAHDSVVSPYGTSTVPKYLVYPTAVRYTFAVERTWKGPVASEVTITDYDVGSECERGYQKGQAYLVYAQKDQRRAGVNELTTTICSRVLLKSAAAADRRLLGRGQEVRS